MSTIEDVDKAIDEFYRKVDVFTKTLKVEAAKKIAPAKKAISIEFGLWQQEKVRDLFNDVVTTFYSSYTPSKYTRQGDVGSKTGGLYEILDIQTDADGQVIGTAPMYDELYNPAKMHPNRSGGDNLYQTVFVEGYHGGASSIGSNADVWGEHPSPGTPYWRTGGFVKYSDSGVRKYHKYGKWGRRAVRSASPRSLMGSAMLGAEAEMDNKFYEIASKYNDAMRQDIEQNVIPSVGRAVFGRW